MTSREEIIANAAQMQGAIVQETDEATMVSGEDSTEESYSLYLEHTGYMTIGSKAMPGVELEDGPIFGSWPGLAVLGRLYDPSGKEIQSRVLNNSGVAILLPNPESVLDLVQAALAVCLTTDQVNSMIDVLETMIASNIETNTPTRLIEQMAQSMRNQGEEFRVFSEEQMNRWTENDPTGLMNIAIRVNMPEEELEALHDVLSGDADLSTKMEAASPMLAKYGVNLVNMSSGVPEHMRGLLKALYDAGALQKVAQMGDLSAMGVNVQELLSQMPPEVAEQFKKQISEQLEGSSGEED